MKKKKTYSAPIIEVHNLSVRTVLLQDSITIKYDPDKDPWNEEVD